MRERPPAGHHKTRNSDLAPAPPARANPVLTRCDARAGVPPQLDRRRHRQKGGAAARGSQHRRRARRRRRSQPAPKTSAEPRASAARARAERRPRAGGEGDHGTETDGAGRKEKRRPIREVARTYKMDMRGGMASTLTKAIVVVVESLARTNPPGGDRHHSHHPYCAKCATSCCEWSLTTFSVAF